MTQQFTQFETLEACPVCMSREISRAYEPDISRCRECHVFFRTPRPTQDDIKKSYDSGSTFEDWIPQEKDRREGWKRRLRLIVRHISSGDLLDVGTGDGHFLEVAQEAGFTVEGTELSDDGINRAKSRGYSVRKGQLTDIDFGEKRFDVITIWHVLEHVPNPGEVIRKSFSLLRPGGILVVAVPDEENILFRHRIGLLKVANPFGRQEWGHEIHLTHFQPFTLRRRLRLSGFQVIEFGVDDIYARRTLRNLCVLAFHKTLAFLFGWHFNMAMYCIGKR